MNNVLIAATIDLMVLFYYITYIHSFPYLFTFSFHLKHHCQQNVGFVWVVRMWKNILLLVSVNRYLFHI